MPSYSENVDRTKWVIIQPEITRVFWSHTEAFRGDTVSMHVETRYVPDGTALQLHIWDEDEAQNDPDDCLQLLEGNAIENNRCVLDYELSLSDEAFRREMGVEAGVFELYFVATIEDFELSKRSQIMKVQFAPFLFSA